MNDHFYLPREIRRGFVVLLVLTMALHIVSLIVGKGDRSDLVLSKNDVNEHLTNTFSTDSVETVDETQIINPIDPNTASLEELIEIGMSKYAAQNFVKYRSTGWSMQRVEELLDVYGVDTAMFLKVRQFLVIGNASVHRQPKDLKAVDTQDIQVDSSLNQIPSFDPNIATRDELVAQGFSVSSATNLIKYIERGGRIGSASDLLKIYGVDSGLVKRVSHRIYFGDTESVAKTSVVMDTTLTFFDPNTSTTEDLLAYGMDRYTATNLTRYIAKGGRIRDKEELKKIYGLNDSIYSIIEKYIRIADVDVDTPLVVEDEVINAVDTVYNLNTITATELIKIKGIGKYYSRAIIEYRERLGGYYSVDQLREVPALREEHFLKLKNHFRVDGDIQRLIAPAHSIKELIRHPYIDYEMAKRLKNISILDYEERLQELITNGTIDYKLATYLQKY